MTPSKQQPLDHDVCKRALIDEQYVPGLPEHLQACPGCNRLADHLRHIDELAATVVARSPGPPDGLLEAILNNGQQVSGVMQPASIRGNRPSNRSRDDRRARSRIDRGRVLIIEDDIDVAEMYKVRLELDDYDVTIACDGVSGLEMAGRGSYAAILLDLRLPKMDGLDVLEGLRSDPRTGFVPVVILSNYSEVELVARSVALGAVEYLVKSQATPSAVSHTLAALLRTDAAGTGLG